MSLELLPCIDPGSGVRKCDGFAFPDEITKVDGSPACVHHRAQRMTFKLRKRADVELIEECDWFALWLEHSHGITDSVNWSADLHSLPHVVVTLGEREVAAGHGEHALDAFRAALHGLRSFWMAAVSR